MESAPEILILDTDRKRYQQTRLLLKDWGYGSDVATNARAADDLLRRSDGPGIVLLFLTSFAVGADEVLAHAMRAKQARPLLILAGLDKVTRREGRQLPEIAPGFRPDDAMSLPLEPRMLRSKLYSAERILAGKVELAEAARALNFFSSHDALTSLPHRAAAMECIAREINRCARAGSPLSAVIFDLDMFSQFNVSMGFQTGSRVLRELGLRLRRCLQEHEAAARYGNDEFLLLLPQCRGQQAAVRAARLAAEVLAAPFDVAPNAAPVRLTACFGVAESAGGNADLVLREAERSLREARQQGPGSIVVASPPPDSPATNWAAPRQLQHLQLQWGLS